MHGAEAKTALAKVAYAIWLRFYDFFGLKWYSCDYLGSQCARCGRSQICDVMLKIFLKIVWMD